MRVHLDTDIGSDPDDACALAMVLGWPGAELVGVTTVDDAGGRRAGYAERVLQLAGRQGIPVAAGAGASLTTSEGCGSIPDEHRYWSGPVPRRPSRPGSALDLLESGIEAGATVVATGPCTNLALLEIARPGTLRRARVVVMGGWIDPLDDDVPAWGPERDWNIQCDTMAATILAATAALTLVPLAVTLRAHLRAKQIGRLRASGALGELLARQAHAYAEDLSRAELAAAHEGLPDDLLNFHHDPLACAVALGWPQVTTEEIALRPALEGGILSFRRDSEGDLVRVVTGADGAAFAETWMSAVEAAQHGSPGAR